MRGAPDVFTVPTAKQLAVVRHDTALRLLVRAPAGPAPGAFDQCPPASTFASAVLAVDVPELVPTARQLVGLAHDTPASELWVAKAGSALVTRAHAVPFQVSMSDFRSDDPYAFPTATHAFVAAHDTPANSPVPETALGLATIDHAVPFQRSVSVR